MSLLADLMGQIRCDAVSFEGLDSNLRAEWFWQGIPDWDDDNNGDLDQVHWEHYWDCQPCHYADRSGDLRRITKVSDFYSARQWHSIGMYYDFFRPLGWEHQLILARLQVSSRTAAVTRAFP